MEDETHGSVPLRSVRQGLESVFRGWYLHDPVALYDAGGLQAISEYFRIHGERFGYARSTPVSVLATLTDRLYEAGRIDDAAIVLLRDPDNYPPSSTSLFNVAEAYRAPDNVERVREYYELSLKAYPRNELARAKLVELGVNIKNLVREMQVPRELLATYTGQYRLPPDRIITVRLKGGRLTSQTAGFEERLLAPLSQNRFHFEDFDGQVTFHSTADGRVTSLTMHLFGDHQVAARDE